MRALVNIVIITLTVLACAWFSGCGSTDLLDETNDRYITDLTVTDAGEVTQDIDVTQDPDCDDDGNWTDPEPFTNVFGTLSVTVSKDASRIHLRRYRVDFIRELSDDGSGTLSWPPEIPGSVERQFESFSVAPNTTGSQQIIIMTMDTKAYYNSQAVHNFAQYTIQVTVYCEDDNGKTFTLYDIYHAVILGYYDNC